MKTPGPTTDSVQADRRLTRRGLQRYGILTAATATGVVLVAAGMPGHFLWPWLGVPLILLFVISFAPLLFYLGRFLWEALEKRDR